jgi:hypothetical protein
MNWSKACLKPGGVVSDAVQRREHFGRETPAFDQNRLDQVRRGIFEPRKIGITVDAKHILQHIARFGDGSGVAGHEFLSLLSLT